MCLIVCMACSRKLLSVTIYQVLSGQSTNVLRKATILKNNNKFMQILRKRN